MFFSFAAVFCALRGFFFAQFSVTCARNSASRQGERDDLRSRWSAEKTAAAGGDDDVLAAVFAHESHRQTVGARVELGFPQLLAALRLECAEAAINGRTDKD
jgi:hypothetical protein